MCFNLKVNSLCGYSVGDNLKFCWRVDLSSNAWIYQCLFYLWRKTRTNLHPFTDRENRNFQFTISYCKPIFSPNITISNWLHGVKKHILRLRVFLAKSKLTLSQHLMQCNTTSNERHNFVKRFKQISMLFGNLFDRCSINHLYFQIYIEQRHKSSRDKKSAVKVHS